MVGLSEAEVDVWMLGACFVVIDFHFVLLKPFSFFFPLVVCLIGYQMLDVQLVLRQALENVWTEPLGDTKVRWKYGPFEKRISIWTDCHSCRDSEMMLVLLMIQSRRRRRQ